MYLRYIITKNVDIDAFKHELKNLKMKTQKSNFNGRNY